MQQAIVLQALNIRADDYYSTRPDRASTYTGTLEFRGSNGEIKIRLNPDLSAKVLAVVSEAMVESTKELARNLTADVLSGTPPALPAPDHIDG